MLWPPTRHVMWLIRFFLKFPITTGDMGCSTGGPPMAMNGIPNNLPPDFCYRWQGIKHTWAAVVTVELTWLSVSCNGVLARVIQMSRIIFIHDKIDKHVVLEFLEKKSCDLLLTYSS